jgi:hypothetical protein
MMVNAINFYSVSENLTVTKFENFAEAVKQEDSMYYIKEIIGTDPNTVKSNVGENNVTFPNACVEMLLLNKAGDPYFICEKEWVVSKINITYRSYTSYSLVIPEMVVTLPSKHVLTLQASEAYHNGIIELHKIIRQLSRLRSFRISC